MKRLILFLLVILNRTNNGIAEPILHLQYGNSQDHLSIALPANTADNRLLRLEASSDLELWSGRARRYPGADWHPTQPLDGAVLLDGPAPTFLKTNFEGTLFFRLLEKDAPTTTAAERVSAFLQQSTFGPRKADIDAFLSTWGAPADGQTDGPYLSWIDAQMALDPFLHRAWFRRQSDPDYIDQSSLTDPERNHFGEVAHDPSLGHRLSFFRGSTAYKADTSCALEGHGGETGQHMLDAIQERPELPVNSQENDLKYAQTLAKHIIWYEAALHANDQLRQRMAWALSQHFVVGEEGSNFDDLTERWTSYYDIFVRNAFGNFRDILSEVTWHPHMGYYLSHLNNRKEIPARNIYPDENYAREVMQLFTIGLWQLQPDGQLILDAHGQPIPTYDNDNITEFARIFTGFLKATDRTNIEIRSGNWVDPMRIVASRHDFESKVLLDGSLHGPFPATIDGARQDIEGFLDHLFEHPNVPPFVANFLIQRFTVSNPSPGYIEAVSEAFATGLFNGQGTGQRGDLAATLKAILLHPEARSTALAFDPAHGKLREPLIRLMHFARAMHLYSDQTYGVIPLQGLDDLIGQGPYQSPSVFNFYRPDYQPNGAVGDRGLSAPEFQIHTAVTGLNLPNALHNLAHNGLRGGPDNAKITPRYFSQGDLDFSEAISTANQAGTLIDFLDLVLCAGRLTDENRAILLDEIANMPGGTTEEKTARVRRALSLFALLPEFNTLY